METVGESGPEFDKPPNIGLKLKLNHEFPYKSKQIVRPRPSQILEMVPLSARYSEVILLNRYCILFSSNKMKYYIFRYFKYYVGKKMHKKRPIMDYVNMISAQRMYGEMFFFILLIDIYMDLKLFKCRNIRWIFY